MSHVCPASASKGLDFGLRKKAHNPKKMFAKYLKKGMTAMDFGCGPGFFTIDMAKMVGKDGKVLAVDLQYEMLEKLKEKNPPKWVHLIECEKESINIEEKLDFALGFYVVHEVPDKEYFFKTIHGLLKKGGILYFSEPIFHVSKKKFEECVNLAKKIGFKEIERPKLLISKTIVLRR